MTPVATATTRSAAVATTSSATPASARTPASASAVASTIPAAIPYRLYFVAIKVWLRLVRKVATPFDGQGGR